MSNEDTMRPDEKDVIEDRLGEIESGDRISFEDVMDDLGIDLSGSGGVDTDE